MGKIMHVIRAPRSRHLPIALAAAALLLAGAGVLTAVLASGPSTGSGSGGGRSGAQAPLSDSATGFAGAALPGAGISAPDFTLTDERGRLVSLRSLRGSVVVLAFLSTDCPPACPLIAQQIRGAIDELDRPPAVLLVSADPRADTPARVAAFLAAVSLAGRARFLSGSAAALAAVWRAYRVVPAAAGKTAFEGAATVRLIDRAGRERVLFGLEQLTPEGLAHDIRRLSG